MKNEKTIQALRTLHEALYLKDAVDKPLLDAADYIEKASKQVSIFLYIFQQIRNLEVKTGFVIVLQFAAHPSGNLAMVFRAHNPRTSVESPPISDVILMSEVEDNSQVIPRLEVLFTEIHKALNSLQVINPKKMLEVIH